MAMLACARSIAKLHHVLDWFHVSMRFQNLKQLAKGINGLSDGNIRGHALAELERAKWRFWNGQTVRGLIGLVHLGQWARTRCFEHIPALQIDYDHIALAGYQQLPDSVRVHLDSQPGRQSAYGRERSLVALLPEPTHDRGFAMTSSFTSMLLAARRLLLPDQPVDIGYRALRQFGQRRVVLDDGVDLGYV